MKRDDQIELNISKIIKRYPFNGRSNYLIDKFYIIGYNIPTLHKLLIEYNDKNSIIFLNKQNDEDKNKTSINLQPFQIKEDPILLNEFSSDFTKDCLDFEMLKEMILPNRINLYYSEEPEENENEIEYENDEFTEYEEFDLFNNDLLKTHSVVFSSNPQIENNSKKSINGYAYIFYKKLKRRKINQKKVHSFYIPIIFSIISEFPYYNSFYKLCNQIKNLYSYPRKEVPIEIMLSNIINYTLSPLNNDVNLSIKPISFLNNENEKQINKTKAIPEVINEEEEDNSNKLTKCKVLTEDNFMILKKQTSDNLNEKDIIYKTTEPESKRKQKSLIKTNSEIFNCELNLAKTQTVKKSFSPSRKLDMMVDYRKNRRTFTDKNMNAYKKKLKNKNKKKQVNQNSNYNTEELFPTIKFGFLPGYPLIQYNLAKVLLYTLSPVDVIEIFLYTFLEKDVIFFSKNLEYLSLTINSYLNLNFPLNDEKYYFINASVSFDNYINNNSPFVGSTFTTILGINDQYNIKYTNSSNKLKEHLAVDLDKGEIFKVDDKSNKLGTKRNKELFNLIRKICKKEIKNDKKQTILAREVNNLNKKLNDMNNLLVNNNDEYQNNEGYKLFKNGDFLEYDEDFIKKQNLDIQNAFYRLINNLCLYFYQNLSIKTEDDDLKKNNKEIKTPNKKINKTEMNVIFRDDYKYEEDKEKAYTKEELYFLEELRETMKYESFVYSFVQSYSPIDLYKIPLTFTEEFLSIISRKSNILEKSFDFFAIIDSLYENKSLLSQPYLYPFFVIYYKYYKDYFDREINDINEENILNQDLIKLKYIYDESNNKYYLKYKDYELDNNILMNYLNLTNNCNEEINVCLSYFSDVIKNNVPKEILVINIENIIENYSIKTHLLSVSDLCCSNIILLFSLSLNFFDSNIDVQSFLGLLFQQFTVFRKYYSYVMNMIYLLFSKNISQKNYSKAHFYLLSYYICVNSIRNLKLVPNESLMNIMKKFNEIDLKTFHENVVKHQDISNNQNNNIGSKIEIYQREGLTRRNLFVCYNCIRNRFIKEDQIINIINDSNNKDDTIKIDGYELKPRIKYIKSKSSNIKGSIFYSQTSMLYKLIGVYNKYIVDFDESHVEYELLVDTCANILIYMRNCNEFTDKDEIKDIVEIILFLFLNKLEENNKVTNKG